jgi:hypothetical protein
MLGEKAIRGSRLHSGGAGSVGASGIQAFTRRYNGNVARHDMRVTQFTFFHTATQTDIAAASKFSGRDAGDRSAHTRIGEHQVSVGEKWLASTDGQRSDKSAATNNSDAAKRDYVHAIETASVPWVEDIMRTHWEPSDGAKPKSDTRTEANEGHKRRRP